VNILVRCLFGLALVLLAWPEIDAYRGELLLARTRTRLADVLNGATRGDAAIREVQTALDDAQQAEEYLPGDQRPVLSASVALLLLHRGAEAVVVLQPAIAEGERPELILNLGRARGILGDEKAAQAAFLHAAWASPAAVATLPAAIREPLLDRVKQLEQDLRAGRLQQVPPL
jgi:hypothetical protein